MMYHWASTTHQKSGYLVSISENTPRRCIKTSHLPISANIIITRTGPRGRVPDDQRTPVLLTVPHNDTPFHIPGALLGALRADDGRRTPCS